MESRSRSTSKKRSSKVPARVVEPHSYKTEKQEPSQDAFSAYSGIKNGPVDNSRSKVIVNIARKTSRPLSSKLTNCSNLRIETKQYQAIMSSRPRLPTAASERRNKQRPFTMRNSSNAYISKPGQKQLDHSSTQPKFWMKNCYSLNQSFNTEQRDIFRNSSAMT